MKKVNLLLLSCFLSLTLLAQRARTITGNITSNVTFFSDTIYTIDGYVFVKNNATLTIQPGTIIKGKSGNKSTLVITRNGRIIANGTRTMPIVFTSDKPAGSRQKGDWGGVVLLGKARTNRPTDCTTCPGAAVAAAEPGVQVNIEGDIDNSDGDGLFGGTDDNHSSGIMRYCRIEFSGTVITPGNEINGLTMGAIGKGTIIEYVQVSFNDDDAFEWFGGNADAKYLVSFRNVDDDFDTDFGFRGRIQYGISIRDSALFDVGSGPTTNGFESDNDGAGTEAQPYTSPVFSNMTVIGPLANGTPLSSPSSFQNGIRIRRNSQTSLFNSIVMGWPDGLFIDGARSGNKFINDTLLVRNNILAGNLRAVNNSSSPAAQARAKVFSSNNDSVFSAASVLVAPFNYLNPDFRPTSSSIANSGASFTGALISDNYFEPTTFRGAMGQTDWTKCWCDFDPQNANYNNAPLNRMPVTFTAVRDTNVCSGRSVVIGQNIAGPYKFSWTPSTGLNNANIARPTASPNATTKYFITITDSITGCFITDSVNVNVITTPTPDFTTSLGSNGQVTFTNSSTNATTYLWNFGNGNTSTATNPTHTYTSNGTYNVRLTAFNGNCSNTLSRIINVTGIASPRRAISGNITTNTTFFRDTIYELNGYVFVKNNATLTIQSGTIVKGAADKATLVITRNGRIIAEGTKNQPIVFTSNKPAGSRQKGDWGGVVILGKARTNRPTDCTTCPGAAVAAAEPGVQVNIEGDIDNSDGDGLFGGTDDNHSSGIMRYCRIEFSGTVITPGNEINGLTMGAIGKGTIIEYVQVSFNDDDAFEWFGGNADAKYLVSFRNVDDDFDTDFGFRGRIQYGISIRDSALFDVGSGPTTNGFESDNDGAGTEAQPYTSPVFSNMTVIGPLANGTPLSSPSSFQNGIRIRRNSQTSLFNSIVMGWPDGLFIDGARSGNKFINDTLLVRNNILAGNLRAVNNSSSPAAQARAKVFSSNNDSVFSAASVLVAPFNYLNPDFRPTSGSIANSGASFTGALISDNYFERTTFRGALGSNPDSNWTNCWCNWDPQNANYNSAPINNPAATAQFTFTIQGNGRTVNFNNSSSNAMSYIWFFGTPDNDTSTSTNPTFIFPGNGKFNVTLIARSACGNSTKTLEVEINDVTLKPVANFTFVKDADPSRRVVFTNTTDEKGFATTYLWNFGDGNTSTDKNPSHTYTSSGTYNVKLVATGLNGMDSIVKQVPVILTTVQEAAGSIAQFNLYPNPTKGNFNLSFELIRNENLEVLITDVTGKTVKVINNENYGKGLNNIIIEAEGLKTGIYLVTLKGESFSKTSRLMIKQ